MKRYAIGLDIGGSSAKAALFDLCGRLIATSSTGYSTTHTGGGIEYSPDDILTAAERSVAGVIRYANIDVSDVCAICCDAMISGVVGIDSAGSPTTPYTTTLDTRFAPFLSNLASHENRIRELAGSGVPVVAAKIAWHRAYSPEAFARTAKFVLAGGFVGMHLAGIGAEDAFVDPTVLWAVGLSDTKRREWSSELASTLDIPMGLLPEIVASTRVVGGVCHSVAGRTGLRAGTPVVAGCGDQMAGFLGAGLSDATLIGDSAGTFEVVGRRTSCFDAAGLFDVIPSPIDNAYIQQAVVNVGAGVTRQWFDALWTPTTPDPDTVPAGSDGLLFVPHLGGQAMPSRPDMRGAWVGLSWNHTSAHFARSVLEASAYELATAIEHFGETRENSTIVGYGGGAQNPLACQIKSDVTGLPYATLGDISPASYAAAMIGAMGVGQLDAFPHVPDRAIRIFHPRAANARTYRSQREQYLRTVDALAPRTEPTSAIDD